MRTILTSADINGGGPLPAKSFPALITGKIIDDLNAALGIATKIGKDATRVYLENLQLLDTKQQDYGPHNIGLFGEMGCVVRASDKIMRLRNLLTSDLQPTHESFIDSYRDLSNYGVIAQLCREGIWPLIT